MEFRGLHTFPTEHVDGMIIDDKALATESFISDLYETVPAKNRLNILSYFFWQMMDMTKCQVERLIDDSTTNLMMMHQDFDFLDKTINAIMILYITRENREIDGKVQQVMHLDRQLHIVMAHERDVFMEQLIFQFNTVQ